MNINKILNFNESVEVEKITGTAAEEIIIPYDEADQKLVIVVFNDEEAPATVTFKKGEMLQATEDLIIEVPANTSIAVALESGKFKNKDGNVKATVSADLAFQLIALP